MRHIRPTIILILWYLAGCFVGSLLELRYFPDAVVYSPIALTLYFRYPDILFGGFGMGVIGSLLTLGCALTGIGIHARNRKLAWYSANGLAFSVGSFGSFAVMMAYTVQFRDRVADDAAKQRAAAIEELKWHGAQITYDDKASGKVVLGVSLTSSEVGDEDLKGTMAIG